MGPPRGMGESSRRFRAGGWSRLEGELRESRRLRLGRAAVALRRRLRSALEALGHGEVERHRVTLELGGNGFIT